MNRFTRLAHSVLTRLMKNRHRLPRVLNRLIDNVAKNPDGLLAMLVARILGGTSSEQIPAPTRAPSKPVRIYIGPTNYAGQGYRWARALEEADSRIAARNMAIELPGGFSFSADTLVPVAVHTASRQWQLAELEAVKQFTHVLFEAERPLFGPLFSRDVSREINELESSGVSCAFLAHGTDIRSPRTHMQRDRFSPYFDDPQTTLLQADADANLTLLRSHSLPVFVSTPDLLIDLPEAVWCPTVVDLETWSRSRPLLQRKVPVVAHFPSMGHTKGTHLIEPTLRRLHAEGLIEYRGLSGIPAVQMPSVIGDADFVLDQFRIGSYGVAAVEAMAAGRLVIGHALPAVREEVRRLSGRELPIVEADPETLEAVLLKLIEDPERVNRTATEGEVFVRAIHSGTLSADVLRENWIDASATG